MDKASFHSEPPTDIAAYALHLTASNIVLLGRGVSSNRGK